MTRRERIYRLTRSGLKACRIENPPLPAHYRRILATIKGDTHSDAFRASIGELPEKQVFDWLDELQTLGFVESRPSAAEHDFDSMEELEIADFLGQQKAA